MTRRRFKTSNQGIAVSEKRQTWLEQCLEHGDHGKAALQAGFSENSAHHIGCNLRKLLAPQIIEGMKWNLTTEAPRSRIGEGGTALARFVPR